MVTILLDEFLLDNLMVAVLYLVWSATAQLTGHARKACPMNINQFFDQLVFNNCPLAFLDAGAEDVEPAITTLLMNFILQVRGYDLPVLPTILLNLFNQDFIFFGRPVCLVNYNSIHGLFLFTFLAIDILLWQLLISFEAGYHGSSHKPVDSKPGFVAVKYNQG